MTDWREELIEQMAKAAWGCDTLQKWEDISKWMQEGMRQDCRAALAVAEPVIREQADNALREENARLREALKPFAEMLKGNYSHQSDDMPIKAGANQYDLVFVFTLGDLRAAAAAIREGAENA